MFPIGSCPVTWNFFDKPLFHITARNSTIEGDLPCVELLDYWSKNQICGST